MLKVEKHRSRILFPQHDTWLFFGPPKVGKTTFAASWENCLIVDLERGTDYVNCIRVQPKDLREFDTLISLLESGHADFRDFQTIAIDTVDVLHDWIENQVCAELNISAIGEAAYGRDYAQVRQRLLSYVGRLKRLDRNILWIAHSRQAIIEPNAPVARTIDLPGKLARFFTAQMDTIGYCFAEEGEGGVLTRLISFKPLNTLEAGSRNPVLQDKVVEMSFEAIKKLFESEPQNVFDMKETLKKVEKTIKARQESKSEHRKITLKNKKILKEILKEAGMSEEDMAEWVRATIARLFPDKEGADFNSLTLEEQEQLLMEATTLSEDQ